MDDFAVIILAAGMGTRMKSDTPKVLHKVFDKTMLEYTIEASVEAGASKIIIVTGYKEDMVRASVMASRIYNNTTRKIVFAHQSEQLGTGHAVKMAVPYLDKKHTVVLCGDTPLITHQTLSALMNSQINTRSHFTLVSAVVEDPTGYGRIIRRGGQLQKIVEQKDATPKEAAICEINSGLYCFDTKALLLALDKLTNNNANEEYYLTDTLEIMLDMHYRTSAIISEDKDDLYGINNKYQLSQATALMQSRINKALMLDGVTMIDPRTTYISKDAVIGLDTTIYPNVYIEGACVIGKGVTLYSETTLKDAIVGDHTTVQNSVVIESRIGQHTTIGPYAYLRPGSDIGDHCRIGDFVEVKNSRIGNGSKASHLSYIGDAQVGENVNLGCGIVTVNYDGKNKHTTTIEDNAFIGCNTNLIAPVTVSKNAYVAAGTTVTENVPSEALAIGRSRQENKLKWRR